MSRPLAIVFKPLMNERKDVPIHAQIMRQMRTGHRNETFHPVRTGSSTRRGPKRHKYHRDLRHLQHSYSGVTISRGMSFWSKSAGSFLLNCPTLFVTATESAFPNVHRTVYTASIMIVSLINIHGDGSSVINVLVPARKL